MQYFLTLAALAGYAAAQGVTAQIPPPGGSPPGCSPDYSGSFGIQTVNIAPSRKRQAGNPQGSDLTITLANGILTDSQDRTGYIAANRQFQFDGPPQTGARFTAGWTICPNNSIALGPTTLFYQCRSGSFFNIYDRPAESECIPIHIQALGSGSIGGAASSAPAPAPSAPAPAPSAPAPAPSAPAPAPAPVPTQIPDGQVQAPTPAVTQIPDGQIQAPTPGAAYTPPAPVYTGAASSNQIGGAVALVAGAFAALL